jgi:HEAT repeats
MLSADMAAFARASLRVLSRAEGSAGARYLVHLLRKHSLLTEALADPRGSREDAVGAARVIPHIGTPIASELERALSLTLSQPNTAALTARVLRLLDVLEVASAQPRLYLFQVELMAHPETMVRSRSALLVGRTGKNAAFVSRMLMDHDVRVQANAVEALWSFEAEDARPLLLNAARSTTARVSANALVGLYKIGDLSALQMLFNTAQHSDGDRRASAAWAMGETGDPRFLPFLTEWFSRSSGNERVNVLQALGRIRRREKSLAEGGAIDMRVWEQQAEGARRRVVLTTGGAKAGVTGLQPTDFAVWEGSTLIHDYQIAGQMNPSLAISGFVLPRFSSETDPYCMALRDAMKRCLRYKRDHDLWRLDRYLAEPRGESGPPLEKAALPFEESLLGPFAKTHQRGFLSAAEGLNRIIEAQGPKERAADDMVAAFDRQSEAMIKFAGKRRLFLFLPSAGVDRPDRHFARLSSFVANERITLSGFAPKSVSGCEEFQALCVASEGGSFATLAPEEIANQVERIYAESLNRFEITYNVAEGTSPADGIVQITSASGCGRAAFSFRCA